MNISNTEKQTRKKALTVALVSNVLIFGGLFLFSTGAFSSNSPTMSAPAPVSPTEIQDVPAAPAAKPERKSKEAPPTNTIETKKKRAVDVLAP